MATSAAAAPAATQPRMAQRAPLAMRAGLPMRGTVVRVNSREAEVRSEKWRRAPLESPSGASLPLPGPLPPGGLRPSTPWGRGRDSGCVGSQPPRPGGLARLHPSMEGFGLQNKREVQEAPTRPLRLGGLISFRRPPTFSPFFPTRRSCALATAARPARPSSWRPSPDQPSRCEARLPSQSSPL